MTALAPHLTAFFQQRLPVEQRASIHTSDSYAYAFKLLLAFASARLLTDVSPHQSQQWLGSAKSLSGSSRCFMARTIEAHRPRPNRWCRGRCT